MENVFQKETVTFTGKLQKILINLKRFGQNLNF